MNNDEGRFSGSRLKYSLARSINCCIPLFGSEKIQRRQCLQNCMCRCTCTEVEITAGHRTFSDQIVEMTDQIPHATP